MGRRPKLGPRRLLLAEAGSQLPAPSRVQTLGWRGAGLPSLGCSHCLGAGWVMRQDRSLLTRLVPGRGQSSLPAVPGFACQPAALGLAGTSGARGLLGGVLGPAKTLPLDLFATVCVQ